MEPQFRRAASGKLSLADTYEALTIKQEHRERSWVKPLAASVVRSKAEAAVRRLNGNIANSAHLLGQFTMQFGQFRDQTFQWLASNALGYAAYIVTSTSKEPASTDARWVNKMALKRYLEQFPEGKEAVQLKSKEKPGPKAPAQVPQPVQAAPDVMSDTDDLELSAMVDKIDTDLQGSQSGPSTEVKETVTEVGSPVSPVLSSSPGIETPSPVSGSSSSGKSSGSAKKKVRSVSAAPKKTARSLFLSPTTSVSEQFESTQQTPVSSQQLTLQNPVSDSEVPLLKKWRATLPTVDHEWVSTALFIKDHRGRSRYDFTKVSCLWINPPQPPLIPQSVPKLEHFFGHRLFLWMPVKLWSLRIACPHPDCDCRQLSFAGVYPVVRQVLDVSGYYNLISETLWCSKCKRKMVSWSFTILRQINIGHRSLFPCLLTTMKACDMKVVILLRQRGLGNSASQVQKKITEQHSTEWYNRTIQYLSACKRIKSAASSGLVQQQSFVQPPPLMPVPQYRWLMQVYIQDVLLRLEEVKANITSVFGRILKVDSTKKVTKKLAGPSAGTAEWATNVGNEYGMVLMSVMTAGEGRFGLHRMAKGLMKRYVDASKPPPQVMYVDRDCCGRSSIKHLFSDWSDMHVRLDVWHFMRRLSSGCNTDSHPLYSLFMQKLSQCIFAWDTGDLEALKAAKRSELVSRHIVNPSEEQVMGMITKSELALHCRRQTRGGDETIRLITALIDAFDCEKGRDTLGVPLLNSRRMREEWEGQKRHAVCLQDPEGIQLYIQTGTLKKGGHTLPVYRSCRGSTSLESFHLHLNRFIPGTLANDTVFQAYLVDGLSRWNQDRASALTQSNEPQSYSGLLRFTANQLTEEIFQGRISSYTPPRRYTGELIGIEYLYDQTGRPLQEYDDTIQIMEDDGLDVPEEDEGFQDVEYEDMTIPDPSNVTDQSEPLQELSPVRRETKIPEKTSAQSEPLQEMSPVRRETKIPEKTSAQSEPLEELSPVRQETQIQLQTSEPPVQFTQTSHDAPVVIQQTLVSLDEHLEPVQEMTPVTSPRAIDKASPEIQPADIHESVGPDHIEGYNKVQALAAYLVELQSGNMCLTNAQAEEIVQLWNGLNDYDKNPIVFNPMFAKHSKGRYRAKRQPVPGVESTERSVRGPDSIPATWPDCNRYVEALVQRLCTSFPGSRRRDGQVWSRWSLILEAYSKIKVTVISNAMVMTGTNLQLPDISQKTLKAWYNDKERDENRQVLHQGIRLPEIKFTATKVLPQPERLQGDLTLGSSEQHPFHLPEDTTGTVVHTTRKITPAATFIPSVQAELQEPAIPAPIPVATPLASLPYTTLRYRKRKEAEEAAGLKRRKYDKVKTTKTCKKCGQIIEKPAHINYFGNLFCQNTEHRTYEEWKEQFEHKNYGKKK